METTQEKDNFFVKHRILLILGGIMLASVAIFCFQASQKLNYHEDEIMTFTLANSVHDGWIEPTPGKAVPAEETFFDAMTVHKGGAFNYKQVYINQTGDVHPYFYYALIHTICSFFPDTFTPWFGLGLNLFFLLLNILLVYRITFLLSNNKNCSLLAAAAFAFCPGIFEIAMFIRMYILAMFFCLALIEFMLTYWGDKKFKVIDCIKLVFIIDLGALTHYYCIFFSILFSIAFVIMLLAKKRFIKALVYSLLCIFTGALSVWSFPPMLYHVLKGYRGTEAIGNITAKNDFVIRMLKFSNMISKNIFSYLGVLLILAAIIIIIVKRKSFKGILKSEKLKKVLFLAVPTACYFLFVSKTAAYIEPRYISLIFPGLIVLFVFFIFIVIKRGFSDKKVSLIAGIALLVVTASSSLCCSYVYSYKDYREVHDIVAKYSDFDCLYLCDGGGFWKADINYTELMEYKTATIMESQQFASILNSDIHENDSLVVCLALYPGEDFNSMLTLLTAFLPNIDSYEEIYSWRDTKVYYFYKKGQIDYVPAD